MSKNGFLAITSVARADGLVRRDETKGLLQAARECGLSEAELSEVSQATENGLPLDNVDLSGLTGAERALTYAFAMWLAKVDGIVNTDELEALRDLGGRLDLPDQKLQAATSAALDIACLPGGNRPEKFEFSKLEARLKQKLPALMSGG